MSKNIYLKKYLLKMGAHIGSGIYEYNYSSELNDYILGSKNNYFIFDINKIVFLIKKSLFFLYNNGILNTNLLFYYSNLNKINLVNLKLILFFLIKLKHKQSFVNNKWTPGSITNFKMCYFNVINILLKINTYNKWYNKKKRINFMNFLSSKKKNILFRFILLRIITLENLNRIYYKLSLNSYLKKNTVLRKYWKFFFFMRSFSSIYSLTDVVLFINPNQELIPLYEISNRCIPIVGLIDSNTSYFFNITYPIISNDDSFVLNLFYITLFLNSYKIGQLSHFYKLKNKIIKMKLKKKYKLNFRKKFNFK